MKKITIFVNGTPNCISEAVAKKFQLEDGQSVDYEKFVRESDLSGGDSPGVELTSGNIRFEEVPDSLKGNSTETPGGDLIFNGSFDGKNPTSHWVEEAGYIKPEDVDMVGGSRIAGLRSSPDATDMITESNPGIQPLIQQDDREDGVFPDMSRVVVRDLTTGRLLAMHWESYQESIQLMDKAGVVSLVKVVYRGSLNDVCEYLKYNS